VQGIQFLKSSHVGFPFIIIGTALNSNYLENVFKAILRTLIGSGSVLNWDAKKKGTAYWRVIKLNGQKEGLEIL
jgi:hypothetical protein